MVGHCLENRDHSKGWTEFDSPALLHSRFSITAVPPIENQVIGVRLSGAGPNFIPRSSNGRTDDFESSCGGSNPSLGTILVCSGGRGSAL